MIKTLIVDDSAIMRAMLKQVLSQDDRFEYAGEAGNGEIAVRQNEVLKPDLIIMDYNMPVMNGLDASRHIFNESNHLPAIIAFTTETDDAIRDEFLTAGILAFFQKPNIAQMNTTQLKDFCEKIVNVYKKRRADVIPSSRFLNTLGGNKSDTDSGSKATNIKNNSTEDNAPNADYKLLAIGSSTGGPEALNTVLSDIGPDFPLPILITQHIDSLFDTHLAKWLTSVTKVPVQLAKNEIIAKKGTAYIAPADKHMTVIKTEDGSCMIRLSDEPPLHFLKPAIDVMFKSINESFGENCIAVILTGMGADGSEELLKMKKNGAYTICQNEETCVVYGMPKAAIDAGAACKILPLGEIGKKIREIVTE